MRSPALAIGWEFRRRHLWALIAMAGYLLALAAIKLLFLGPMEPIRLDPPDGKAAVVITPLAATYFYLLAAFSFGLAGDLGARPSIYPARMFALPVRTAALVGWPMVYGTAAVAILWLVTALSARWPWGIELPLIWPALLAAGDRHRAMAGHAGCRRAAGDSLPGPRADDGGLPGAAAAPRVRHRLLRRWPGSPRRGARLEGNVRPACEQRRADPPARPF